jgi:uroporphyrinogen III methyltransferase/synthase
MTNKVYLVGAGPGDVELITLRGMNVVKNADVIVYDRLSNPKLLDYAKDSCEFVYVGKKANAHTMKQEDINQLLVDEAKLGKMVVRLKGGDPYVFGRGGEEGVILNDRGVEFEVVPGISSSIGGLAYAGIPITYRNIATSFHVFTGHFSNEDEEHPWEAISKLKGTLVFLMGMKNLEKIVCNLKSNGLDEGTPVAIVNWATRSNQRVVTGNLRDIVDVVKEENIKAPSLIVVGDVVDLREKLEFFEKRPLYGQKIVVTRARAQSSKLVDKLSNLGATVFEYPSIQIREIEDNENVEKAMDILDDYTHIVFTSINGVNIFFERLFDRGFDSRDLANSKLIAVGSATKRALRNYGLNADWMPENYDGDSLANGLREMLKSDHRVLIPRAKNGRADLIDSISEVCKADEVILYESVVDESNVSELNETIKKNDIDYITFTSSSTVKYFMEKLTDENRQKVRGINCVSIGPITSDTLKNYDMKFCDQAEIYTIDGVVDRLIYLAQK